MTSYRVGKLFHIGQRRYEVSRMLMHLSFFIYHAFCLAYCF